MAVFPERGIETPVRKRIDTAVLSLSQMRPSMKQPSACARRWLALDPLHEPAHRQLMSLYEISGQRAAALRQYETCRQTLSDELGG